MFDSFKAAFPKRCIPQSGDTVMVPFQSTNQDEISRTSIEIKAKRLEQSQIYKKVVGLLQTNLYISYAIERMSVLDVILDRIKSGEVSDRDLSPLAKTFLDATAKPAEAKGMELSVNVQNNNVSIVSIEDKLSTIAKSLDGKNATEIIEVLSVNSPTSEV
jgi:hypothetical protein